MRRRWLSALIAVVGIVMSFAVIGAAGPGGLAPSVLAQQQTPQVSPPNAPPAPGNPPAPGYGPGTPGFRPWRPGSGPGFRREHGARFGPGKFSGGRGGRGFRHGGGMGIIWGWIALNSLLRFVLMIALLVIAWKAITSRSLWGRPDAAVQLARQQFARGDITEEEYRRRLAALS